MAKFQAVIKESYKSPKEGSKYFISKFNSKDVVGTLFSTEALVIGKVFDIDGTVGNYTYCEAVSAADVVEIKKAVEIDKKAWSL